MATGLATGVTMSQTTGGKMGLETDVTKGLKSGLKSGPTKGLKTDMTTEMTKGLKSGLQTDITTDLKTSVTTNMMDSEEKLQAALLSLLYALGRAARRMKGKLTVQTRLTSSFASVMRGVGEYSPLLVSR